MPVIPEKLTMRAPNWDIVNGVRDFMPLDWSSRVPVATQDNMNEVANPILQFESYRNSFIDALVNRIALTLITSKMFYNPLRMFKRGTLQYGESVEEIFVNIAKAHSFDPQKAETNFMNRELPDVKSAFHRLNAKDYYKVTISNEELRTAFLSDYGLSDLIGRIVESLYNGAQYDEFLQMKHIVADAYKTGNVYPVHVDPLSESTAKNFVRTVKGMSDTIEFMSNKYNPMGVVTYSSKADQILLISASANAYVDVDVLASAFNMDKAEFMGQRVLVDDLGDPSIVAALVDREFFMVFNNFEGFTENYNGEGLYWNYWYHIWRTYSRSPFANAIVFTTNTPTVSVSGTLTPNSVNGTNGGSTQITNTSTATNGASNAVTYELTLDAKELGFTLNDSGVIGIPAGTPANSSFPTVTLTSVYDPTKSATINLSITGN